MSFVQHSRHGGREGRKECLLCDAECESVSHVLDCPAYASIRSAFMLELRRELGDRFEHFQSLDSFEKSSYSMSLVVRHGKNILVGCSKTLCLVYGRKGYMANTLTFTSLILRMTLGI